MINIIGLPVASMIFIVFMFIVFVLAWHRNRKFFTVVDIMEKNMCVEFKNVLPQDSVVDVYFDKDCLTEKVKAPLNIINIAGDITKGYDFFLCNTKEKQTVDITKHKHNKTNEFFYMLKGKMLLYHEKDDPVTIKEKEWVYLPKGEFHGFKVYPDTEYILIAQPPLFTRIGKSWKKLLRL